MFVAHCCTVYAYPKSETLRQHPPTRALPLRTTPPIKMSRHYESEEMIGDEIDSAEQAPPPAPVPKTMSPEQAAAMIADHNRFALADTVDAVITPHIHAIGTDILAANGRFTSDPKGMPTYDLTVHPQTGLAVAGDLENAVPIGAEILGVQNDSPVRIGFTLPGFRGPYAGMPEIVAFSDPTQGMQKVDKSVRTATPIGTGQPRAVWPAAALRTSIIGPKTDTSSLVQIGSPICRYLQLAGVATDKPGVRKGFKADVFSPKSERNKEGHIHLINAHIDEAVAALDAEHAKAPPLSIPNYHPGFVVMASPGKTVEEARELFAARAGPHTIGFTARVRLGAAGDARVAQAPAPQRQKSRHEDDDEEDA